MARQQGSAQSHALAASVYTLLSGLTMLMSDETGGEPSRTEVYRAVVGSFEELSRLRSSFGPEAKLLKHQADGTVVSLPVAALIDIVLSMRPRFEAWDGAWPMPEDCGRAASRLLELSGWPAA
jgi:hypothetical protein